jgi:hypothetical protein
LSQGIAELDWKHFRQLHPIALERFCQKILTEVESVNADDSKSFHQRYLDIIKIIERRDKELANAFNDIRRSTALMQLISIYGLGLLTEAELSSFSQEVVSIVKALNQGLGQCC